MKNEWQPIETAPRDGANVLLYAPAESGSFKERIWIGYWIDTVTLEYGKVIREQRAWWDANQWPMFHRDAPEATHWMPLPAAPVGDDA